jgi:hypothetical protein
MISAKTHRLATNCLFIGVFFGFATVIFGPYGVLAGFAAGFGVSYIVAAAVLTSQGWYEEGGRKVIDFETFDAATLCLLFTLASALAASAFGPFPAACVAVLAFGVSVGLSAMVLAWNATKEGGRGE